MKFFVNIILPLSVLVILVSVLYYKRCNKNFDTKEKNILYGKSINNDIELINIYPRKNKPVYTQGLFIYSNDDSGNNLFLYESGGLYKKSTLTKMTYPEQTIVKQINIDGDIFSEGIAYSIEDNSIYMLTYKENLILVFDIDTLTLKAKIKMPSEMKEGWGFSNTEKDKEFYSTDGSEYIHFIKKKGNNFESTGKVMVTKKGNSLDWINDLIYKDGYIYANKYFTSKIFKIKPETGEIVKEYDFNPFVEYEISTGTLTNFMLHRGYVFNGIAYNKYSDTFIVTGKEWGNYYEVKLK